MGPKTINKVSTTVVNYAKKISKALKGYQISGGGNQLIIVHKVDNRGKKSRVFSLDYHGGLNAIKRRSKPSKNYGGKIWRYHLTGNTHYVIGSLLPKDALFKPDKGYANSYKLVW